jgi:hypothetical protein
LHAPPSRSLSLRRLLLLLALPVVAACDDGPTAPGIYTHPADGRLWVAVRVPQGTPSARTWLPYVHPDRAETGTVDRLRWLIGEAEQQRRRGDLAGAAHLEPEASLLAARSITVAPPPRVLSASLQALQSWGDRAAEALALDRPTAAGDAVPLVRAHRAAAHAALQRGDTLAAVTEVAAAANLIHALSPESVAWQALVDAEQRLAAHPGNAADAEHAVRAARLLRHAREALTEGDQVRALRRALYALQLLDGMAANDDGGRARQR